MATAVEGFAVVIAKSTVLVGASDEIQRLIRQERPETRT